MRLAGKAAIITGAGSGIGRATTLLFVREGAAVAASDIAEAGLQETLRLAAAGPGKVIGVRGDASSEADVEALVAQAISTFGRLDVAYANAGIGAYVDDHGAKRLAIGMESSVDQFKQVLEVNLVGPYILLKHALPHLAKHGKGSFIMTASVAGLRGNAGVVAYGASKGGVIAMANSMAFAVYGQGVRVNAICPGLIETGMYDSSAVKRDRGADGSALNPLRRIGDPSEIASVALFLATDESSYVNGQALPVCGGLTGALPTTPGGAA
jgi:NAD(P)-dependent dehydrogenase (short-subunit alcohol dehydrogenase family)